MMDPAEADMIVSMFSHALVDAVDGAALLREWTEKYPELGPDFAALVVDQTAGDKEGSFEAEAAGQQVLMQRLFSEITSDFRVPAPAIVSDSRAELSDLQTASTVRGIAYPVELARRLRLPSTLLEKIASRRVDIGSIPVVLIQQMSSILEVGRDQVSAWLTSASGLGSSAPAFVREEAAHYGTPSTFATAIENAVDVDDADRDYWRSIMETSRTVGEQD
jgi:hypothetical protein